MAICMSSCPAQVCRACEIQGHTKCYYSGLVIAHDRYCYHFNYDYDYNDYFDYYYSFDDYDYYYPATTCYLLPATSYQ